VSHFFHALINQKEGDACASPPHGFFGEEKGGLGMSHILDSAWQDLFV
jgi:hypothetical protein